MKWARPAWCEQTVWPSPRPEGAAQSDHGGKAYHFKRDNQVMQRRKCVMKWAKASGAIAVVDAPLNPGQTGACRATCLALSPQPDCEQGGTHPILATASLSLLPVRVQHLNAITNYFRAH